MGLKTLFYRLKIKLKLLVAFGSILLLSAILMVTATLSIRTILHHKELNEAIDDLTLQLLKINTTAKDFIHLGYKKNDFLTSGHSVHLEEFDSRLATVDGILQGIKTEDLLSSDVSAKAFKKIQLGVGRYTGSFKNLVYLLRERGFKDHGTEGALRRAIHSVEQSDFDFDAVKMLMLRRHEKDFFLRKDMKYLSRFNALVDEFHSSLKSIPLRNEEEGSLRSKALDDIKDYKEKFNRIVSIEQSIGLTDSEGVKGKMMSSFDTMEPELIHLRKEVKESSRQSTHRSMIILSVVVVLQLFIGFVLVFFYSNLLTRAIKELKTAMISLADGDFPEKMTIRTSDEIGETKKALNELIDRIEAAVRFSTALGNGNLDKNYDSVDRNDVLAKSIISMQAKIIEAEKQKSYTNWYNQGMAAFTDIFKEEDKSLAELSSGIIRTMAKYLDAQQGILYIQHHGMDRLHRLATYAFNATSPNGNEVEIGQGLVGQCMAEKRTLHLSNVPEGYANITSGLGMIAPKSLLVVPLKTTQSIVGVVELSFFDTLEPGKIRFAEKVSEHIANVLFGKQVRERTQALLDQAQRKTMEMKVQEEKLIKNSSELEATKQEIERQKAELESHIFRLVAQVKSKDKAIDVLEAQLKRYRLHADEPFNL